jgi:hypothetical protein
MRKNQQMQQLFIQFISYVYINNILSTAPQLTISQKALGTLPEDSNIMPKHVRATIHN